VNRFLTSKENIVINLVSEWLGESCINRTLNEYAAIAKRIPKIEAVHAYVNQRLREMADARFAPYQISYFRLGDRYPWYADFPKSISVETVRTALKKSGLLELRELTLIEALNAWGLADNLKRSLK
jgi:hypothetical protein